MVTRETTAFGVGGGADDFSVPLAERPEVKGVRRGVGGSLVCMLEASLYLLSRGEAEGMDGKCSHSQKGLHQQQNSSEASTRKG